MTLFGAGIGFFLRITNSSGRGHSLSSAFSIGSVFTVSGNNPPCEDDLEWLFGLRLLR